MDLIYICDNHRHLVCYPYTIKNLHKMAEELKISRVWYKVRSRYNKHPHYDIPGRRIPEIMAKCLVITRREMVEYVVKKTSPIPLIEEIARLKSQTHERTT